MSAGLANSYPKTFRRVRLGTITWEVLYGYLQSRGSVVQVSSQAVSGSLLTHFVSFITTAASGVAGGIGKRIGQELAQSTELGLVDAASMSIGHGILEFRNVAAHFRWDRVVSVIDKL